MKKKNLQDSVKEVMKKEEEGIFPCHKSLKDLKKEAKGLGFVGIGMLNKDGLRKVIVDKKNKKKDCCRATREKVSCIHEVDFFSCLICKENRFCIHGKKRYFCKDCGETQICRHNKKLFNCFPCAEERRQGKKDKWMNVTRGESCVKEVESEDESCEGGCLIEGYDNIYDFVADLNARDN